MMMAGQDITASGSKMAAVNSYGHISVRAVEKCKKIFEISVAFSK